MKIHLGKDLRRSSSPALCPKQDVREAHLYRFIDSGKDVSILEESEVLKFNRHWIAFSNNSEYIHSNLLLLLLLLVVCIEVLTL